MEYPKLKNNILPLLFIAFIFSALPLFARTVRAQNRHYSQAKYISPIGHKTIMELAKPSIYIEDLVPSISVVNKDNASDDIVDNLLKYAFKFKGRPYRSGSKGPSSFDCSGFTCYVFKKLSMTLNASSASQYRQGKSVTRDELKPGDLVFFKGRNTTTSRVGHVGLVSEVLPNGSFKFIHASCSKGICEESINSTYYSKRYIGASRVID